MQELTPEQEDLILEQSRERHFEIKSKETKMLCPDCDTEMEIETLPSNNHPNVEEDVYTCKNCGRVVEDPEPFEE